ncbi:hypothetical protein VP1G_10516 [Cytospora mali]|uniref:Uncharacterized protein n=1 Tax=Cytospora mali TaxID=578113 RepID=A0A194UNR0_CYTMA|nr:hypothetical protein VP1G_10516 [Valsa mali var. pyri (nom. inval.)]
MAGWILLWTKVKAAFKEPSQAEPITDRSSRSIARSIGNPIQLPIMTVPIRIRPIWLQRKATR